MSKLGPISHFLSPVSCDSLASCPSIENVPNRDTTQSYRTEPWILWTVTPLICMSVCLSGNHSNTLICCLFLLLWKLEKSSKEQHLFEKECLSNKCLYFPFWSSQCFLTEYKYEFILNSNVPNGWNYNKMCVNVVVWISIQKTVNLLYVRSCFTLIIF